jgi:predicted ester cyclase
MDKEDGIMSEQTKQVARRLYEAMDRHDPDGFAELLAEDAVNHGTASQGREQSKQELTYWLAAFPDLSITVEHLICEGDKVAVRYTGRATHKGNLGPIPATGKEVAVDQVDILRIEDGQVVEGWYLPDMYGLMRQLDVVGEALAEPEVAAGG